MRPGRGCAHRRERAVRESATLCARAAARRRQPVNPALEIAPEVREALSQRRPVVALESTVIAHGMAYPQNLETALDVESIVRAGGAVPATVAVVGGRLKAGLSEAEIEHIAKADAVMKATARDLPYLA